MNAAAFTAAIAAAKQQELSDAISNQLLAASAITARTATTLDTAAEGSAAALEQMIASGHVRDVGNKRYWLDQSAVARTKASAGRAAWIALAFLVSAGLSLVALLASR